MARPSREHILGEIRRCAADNDGKPLGRQLFEVATGVRESDWIGRYWARWGDAIREAGLEPNELQGQLHSDADLLRHLASLTKELGHYPTTPELRMRRQVDPAFPNANSIRLRLGNRPAQLARLADFTADHNGFEDVHALCLAMLEPAATKEEFENAAKVSIGFVYLVRSGQHYKIGRSNHLGRRSYELALQLAERLELVHAFETDDAIGIERYWHERFADQRVNGEWFSLSRADVAAFKLRRRFM